jgi:hypothetical protein
MKGTAFGVAATSPANQARRRQHDQERNKR